MKRFSDAASEVSAVARRGRSPVPAVSDGEDARNPHACHAYGCPLPGAISDSTVGGGPWLCRHHFGAAASQWADITTRLRREQAHQGDLVTTAPAVPNAVQRIRAEIAELQERRAAARQDREPGEDDE